MKCIQCDTDNNLKDRTEHGGCCSTCNHRFAFEPTTMKPVKITDPMFKKAIEGVSAQQTLSFTPKQLSYQLDRRLRRSASMGNWGCLVFYLFMNIWFPGFVGGFLTLLLTSILPLRLKLPGLFFIVAASLVLQGLTIWWLASQSTSRQSDQRGRRWGARNLRRIGVLVLVVGIFASLFIAPSFILFVAAVCLGMGALYLGNRQLAGPPISQEFLFTRNDFLGWLNRWQEVNGAVVKLLPAPRSQAGNATVNPDVTAYSFDRLVVCDSAEIAQMLIANNFHFENNCAVLSITGYPQDIFATTMEMLHRNPALKVYGVHDCSPKGIGLIQQLQNSDRWFKGSNVVLIDVGLTPRQVMSAPGLFIQTSTESMQAAQQLSPAQLGNLTPAEVQWLTAGNYVELESFTPQRLIQVLNRSIAGSRDLFSDNDTYSSGYITSDSSSGYISSDSSSFG
jgi:hypothetical protein